MAHDLDGEAQTGLERSCAADDRIVSAPGVAGLERIEANLSNEDLVLIDDDAELDD